MPKMLGHADTDGYGYLVYDRDSIFAKHLNDSIRALGLAVLRSPFASPKANSICEWVIGTIRRECLDWMIPLSEPHLRSILHEWVAHYNGGRPHSALGSAVPGAPRGSARRSKAEARLNDHRLTLNPPPGPARHWYKTRLSLCCRRACSERGRSRSAHDRDRAGEERRARGLWRGRRGPGPSPPTPSRCWRIIWACMAKRSGRDIDSVRGITEALAVAVTADDAVTLKAQGMGSVGLRSPELRDRKTPCHLRRSASSKGAPKNRSEC